MTVQPSVPVNHIASTALRTSPCKTTTVVLKKKITFLDQKTCETLIYCTQTRPSHSLIDLHLLNRLAPHLAQEVNIESL